jgi:hypothetical protein
LLECADFICWTARSLFVYVGCLYELKPELRSASVFSHFPHSKPSMHFQFKSSSFGENSMFQLLIRNPLVGVCRQSQNYFKLSMLGIFNFFFKKLFVCEQLNHIIICCLLFTIELLIINFWQHKFIIKYDFFRTPKHHNVMNFIRCIHCCFPFYAVFI